MNNNDVPGWVLALGMLLSAAAGVWGLWCTVIGFIGGTMPIIGIEVGGDLLLGVFMLVLGEPILMTLAYWAFMIVMLPILLLVRAGKGSR